MTYTLNIVTHNSDTFLDDVLNHCWALTVPPRAVVIVDNASNDDTLGIIHSHQRQHADLTVVRNNSNVGFARGHNQAIALSKRKGADAVLILNPDVLLEPNSTRLLMTVLKHDERVGSVGPLLYRMQSGSGTNRVIDSTGFDIKSSLRVVDREAGQLDRGQCASGPAFGGSGAAILYRRSALESVATLQGEIFDELFFAYKEDVDLAFRLAADGWIHWFCAEAVGHHYRSHRSGSILEILQQRKYRSTRTRQHSYRNHFLLLAKNAPGGVLLRQSLWLCVSELAQFMYLLLIEPKTLLILSDVIRKMPSVLKKRWSGVARLASAAMVQRWIRKGI